MADQTITRYHIEPLAGTVMRTPHEDGAWVRYKDAADALTAAHAARDAWRSAALRVGEDMATTGPVGYYEFTPDEWRTWALTALTTALRERDEALFALNVTREVAHDYQQQTEKLEGDLATAERERDEARAKLAPYERATFTPAWLVRARNFMR